MIGLSAMVSGVYVVTNNRNGAVYVGSSVNIAERWRAHRKLLRGGRHTNVHFQNAWRTHGEAAFGFKILLVCERDKALWFEQRALDFYFLTRARNDIYNVAREAAAPTLGTVASAATRQKRSISLRGKKRTVETRARMSAAQRGRVVSEETCRKISASKSGPNHPMWGKAGSAETREKIGRAQIGRPLSAKHREAVGAAARSRAACKLNETLVRQIREAYARGNVSHGDLARAYGVSGGLICGIINNKRWRI